MKDWFLEFLMILSFSKKTQWAIVMGAAGFIVIKALENYMMRDFHLSANLAFLNSVVRDNLLGKYDKAAFGCLFSFSLLAVRQYRKDKKRFYNLFQ